MSEAEKASITEPKTDDKPGKSAKPAKPVNRSAKPSRPSQGGAFFATVVALVAIGLSYYLWQQQRLAEQKLHVVETSLERILSAVEQQHQQQQVRIEAMAHVPAAQGERLDALEQQLQRLLIHVGQQRLQECGLAEVDYMLRIAEHRLQVEGNQNAAIRSLQSAIETLRQANLPEYGPLLEMLERDVQSLITLPSTEGPRLASRLAELEALVPALVLKPAGQELALLTELGTPDTPADGWRGFIQQVWRDLRGLVVIRHQDAESLVAPGLGQQHNMQWLILMRLEAARLALLSGQQTHWQESLLRLEGLLGSYFDTEQPAYAQFNEGLQVLKASSLERQVPDLKPTIDLLESLLPGPVAAPGERATAPLPETENLYPSEDGEIKAPDGEVVEQKETGA